MELRLSPKQNEFICKANHRYNLKVGAVRSGKSYGDMAYVIPSRIRERHGKSGLNFIVGVSTQTIERNVLQPMRDIYTEALVGNINSQTSIAKLFGEPVYCIGAEKKNQVSKIQGSSIKYCYGDEVAKWAEEVFDMLKSRLDKDYSCMDGSLNPESPKHWLKKFIDDPNIDIYLQHYTIFDNPFLSKKFIENLCKEYEGTVNYPRLIEGKWTQAEGLVFPFYMDALGDCPFILSEQTFTKMEDFCLSIDYGTMNAFACLLWVKIGTTWWAWRGYYYSGRDTGIQKTDSQYADEVCKLVEPLFMVQKEKAKKGKVEPDKITAIIDPSAASFIAELKTRKIFKTKHADNDVDDGIRNTNTAIKHDVIKIDRKIKEWQDEAGGYVYDKDTETPVKIDDHYMDATRYFVRTKKLGRIKIVDDGQYEKLLYSEGNMGLSSMSGYF